MSPFPAAAPPRRILSHVARGVSLPLAALGFGCGAILRFLSILLHAVHAGDPERGPAAAAARLVEFLGAAGRYLAWRSDRFPPLWGRVPPKDESPGPWHEARRRLCQSRTALGSWIGIVLYLYVAIGAQVGWVASGYRSYDRDAVYAAPQGLGERHVLGTDQLGRDVADLGLRGTLTALWIGVVSGVLTCFFGAVLGAVAGFFGGWVDACVVALYTTLESIPELLLLLAFAFVFRKNASFADAYDASFLNQTLGVSIGLFTIVLAIGLTWWGGVCRTVRGEFIRHRDRDYVVAAKALGVPTRRILFRHVLPNVFHLVLISFSLLFIGAIKSEVILSFLGVGLDAGEASWGQMITHAKLELTREPAVWWQLTTATGLMFGLVLSVNLFSDALRDALDPRLKV